MIFGGVSDAHTTKNHYMNTTAHHPLPSITIHYHSSPSTINRAWVQDYDRFIPLFTLYVALG